MHFLERAVNPVIEQCPDLGFGLAGPGIGQVVVGRTGLVELVVIRLHCQENIQAGRLRLLHISEHAVVFLPIYRGSVIIAERHIVQLQTHYVRAVFLNRGIRVLDCTLLAIDQAAVLHIGGKAHCRALVEAVQRQFGCRLRIGTGCVVASVRLAAGEQKQRGQ